MVRLQNIDLVFNRGTIDENVLFDNFSLMVNEGEFVAVVGSNGSGKTTLLNLICGTMRPDSGNVMLGGTDVTNIPEYKRAKRIGRVLQDPKMGTCGSLTILENMALADNKNKSYNLGRAVNRHRIDYYKSLLETCGMLDAHVRNHAVLLHSFQHTHSYLGLHLLYKPRIPIPLHQNLDLQNHSLLDFAQQVDTYGILSRRITVSYVCRLDLLNSPGL